MDSLFILFVDSGGGVSNHLHKASIITTTAHAAQQVVQQRQANTRKQAYKQALKTDHISSNTITYINIRLIIISSYTSTHRQATEHTQERATNNHHDTRENDT